MSENLQASDWSYVRGVDDTIRWRLGMTWFYRLEDPATTTKTVGGTVITADVVNPTNLINGNKLDTLTGNIEAGRPSSDHTGIVNYTMLDGAVKSLNDSIDYHVYQALLTPQTKQSDVPRDLYLLSEDDYIQ